MPKIPDIAPLTQLEVIDLRTLSELQHDGVELSLRTTCSIAGTGGGILNPLGPRAGPGR